MLTTALQVLVAMGISLTALGGADQAAKDGAIAARFRQAVEKDFVAYVEALNRYLRSRPPERQRTPPELPKEVAEAFERFEQAVLKNWPFAVPGASQAPAGKSPHVALEAAEAFEAAARFEAEQYFEGKAPRDRAVAQWLSVADRFPGTQEHDQALMRGVLLYMKRLVGEAKRDPGAALDMLKRLASRPGPPSVPSLIAQEEVAVLREDPAKQGEVRANLKRDLRTRQQDVEWLKATFLVPTERTTPRQFAQGIVGVLYHLEGIPKDRLVFGVDFDKRLGPTRPPPVPVPAEVKKQAIPEGLSPVASPAAFRQAVEKEFVAYVEALNGHLRTRPPERRGSYPEPPEEVERAFQRFEDAVVKKWPFAVPGPFQVSVGKSSHVALEAAEAFKAAARFEAEQYRQGKAPRDRAVAEWVSVADRFPGTQEHDKALIRGAVLFTQGLVGSAKRDPEGKRKLLERLASRPGPPSASVMMAQEELIGMFKDPAKRWEARAKVLDDVRTKQQDIEWLKANLLVPSERTTPQQFAHEIVAVLYQLEGIQRTTSGGMEFDKSVGAPKPGGAVPMAPLKKEPFPEPPSGRRTILAVLAVGVLAALACLPWLWRRLRRRRGGMT